MLHEKQTERPLVAIEDAVPQCSIVMLHTLIVSARRLRLHLRPTTDSKAVGRSAESWLAMQDAHDLWVARQTLDLARVRPLDLAAS